MSTFKLGESPLKELEGVHPDLVAIVKRAIELTVRDFAVYDGIRTLEQQKKLVEVGASQTIESRHITGHAVDLVPYINDQWQAPVGVGAHIYRITDAVRAAAKELGMPLRWGGAWDVVLTQSEEHSENLVADYVASWKKAGKKAFIDGPHYESPKTDYP